MVTWENINTVMLDMDGTLLDLHFDNHFWLEHVPLRFAEKNGLTIEQAKEALIPLYRKAEGTLEWYSVDYWTEQLGLDIEMLKQEVDHLIAVFPYVVDFLEAVRRKNKRIVLVTNAHGKALKIKMDRTQLGGHFDQLICSHDLGLPKEDLSFWGKLQTIEPFSKQRTLFIDDSLPVLRSAQAYGIANLLAVINPDSKAPAKDVEGFDAIQSFRQIIPA
ncbi:MAG: GMP/IMP nucleotidase [Acidiferrobacterales bacterium]|jgi:putative hydrolase of the HAD superfamily|nr:GMP/IMP nucleotidase [Acidiferrobacterales bacterium]